MTMDIERMPSRFDHLPLIKTSEFTKIVSGKIEQTINGKSNFTELVEIEGKSGFIEIRGRLDKSSTQIGFVGKVEASQTQRILLRVMKKYGLNEQKGLTREFSRLDTTTLKHTSYPSTKNPNLFFERFAEYNNTSEYPFRIKWHVNKRATPSQS